MKKVSIFVAVMSLVCVCLLSSCETSVKFKGTTKVFVKGYAIGENGEDALLSLEKNLFTPIQGYKMTLENGKTYTSDKNGAFIVSLEAGNYLIKSIEIPAPYYSNYYWDTKEGQYAVKNYWIETNSYGFFNLKEGYNDVELNVYKRK